MTAHCHIAQRLSDGRIKAIYVHNAEPEAEIGPLLAQYYAETAQVSSLLDLGDLSGLGESPRSSRAYGRDRGETGTAARLYQDMDALITAALTSSVTYLYENGQWFVYIGAKDWYRLKPNGYVEWHGPIVPLIEDLIKEARSLKRPFDQEEVIYPLWDAGYGFMLHLDDRFQARPRRMYQPRLWTVKCHGGRRQKTLDGSGESARR